MKTSSTQSVRVSVVLPLLNEADYLDELLAQVSAVLESLGNDWQIVLINDGSTDASPDIIERWAAQDSRITTVHLSRNFGHQAAVSAGLEFADGDVVILMDSDGQDDPNAIPEMIEKWREGFQVVNATRASRTENFVKRAMFSGFYRLLARTSSTPIPRDAGNFGLVDRVVIDQIRSLPERDRYFPGLRAWVGYKQSSVMVHRLPRHDGQPRVRFRGLVALAKTALFGFSRVPLMAFYWFAVLAAFVSISSISFTLYHRFWTGLAIPGWTSVTSVTAFFGAINSLGIAILGEYIARIYDQVRGRPNFVVARSCNGKQIGRLDSDTTTSTEESKVLQQVESIRKIIRKDNTDSKKTTPTVDSLER